MFERIACDPAILNGKPCIKGTRISVEFILDLIASGGTAAEIVREYPQLSPQDIEQAVRFAAEALKNDAIFTERLAG
jgi:uncharacterized protein (DUF433 family)